MLVIVIMFMQMRYYQTSDSRRPYCRLLSIRFPIATEGIRPQAAHTFGHLRGDLGEARALCAGQVEHIQPLATEPNLIKNAFDVFDPALGVYITFQVMTGALQSAGHEDAVRAVFESAKDMQGIHATCAG